MQLQDFDYLLPPELIAQRPPERRDGGRLMVLDRQTGRWLITSSTICRSFFRPTAC